MRWNLLGWIALAGVLAVGVASNGTVVSADESPKQEEVKKEEGTPAKDVSAEKKLTSEEKILKDHPQGGQIIEMLRMHNETRARYNLRPLRLNGRLVQSAQRFAGFMGRTRSFGHYADGRSPVDRMAAEGYQQASWAENIAWSGGHPGVAMNTWMNSGAHRANILSGHEEVGFGVQNEIWVAVYGNPAFYEKEPEKEAEKTSEKKAE